MAHFSSPTFNSERTQCILTKYFLSKYMGKIYFRKSRGAFLRFFSCKMAFNYQNKKIVQLWWILNLCVHILRCWKDHAKTRGVLGNLETFKENKNLNTCWWVSKFIARSSIHQQIHWLGLLDKIHKNEYYFVNYLNEKAKKRRNWLMHIQNAIFMLISPLRCRVNQPSIFKCT